MAKFNDSMNPKAKTELFKIYVDVNTSGVGEPNYELQGRGVTSWTVENNQDVTRTPDVLGYVDIERGIPQPEQNVDLTLRKESQLGAMLFDAWMSNDFSKLDNLTILQKFEFVERDILGASGRDCRARLQKECAITINSFNGEAGGYLSFSVTIYYSNKITIGYMPKIDRDVITFRTESGSDDTDPDDDSAI